MYEKYWELKEKPFENTPDPRFLYHSNQHREALARLFYAVQEKKGAAVLTGDMGCGKTLLSRALFSGLDKKKFLLALIVNPSLTPLQMWGEIGIQLGGKEVFLERVEMMDALGEVLKINHTNRKRSVIIIDEAQEIKQADVFQQLRLLLNYQLEQEFLLTLILLGQPELRDRINQVPPFKQRISVRCHLGPLDPSEVPAYINHRLAVAGGQKPIFAKEALDLISEHSGGVPRNINNICDICLLAGFIEKTKEIDRAIVERTVDELD
ncbi:AAA family ATPase [Nitrospinae bacterium AH_259_B05_G02_I21]|nr:AAA family ATPase [Nitrospinae bacterium AH_259_B05_G02_I21]MDA2932465.1 AAA family ATPase [Nitrospinae bacterium AH-259-F20]